MRAPSASLDWNPIRPAVMMTMPNAQTAVIRTACRCAGPAVGRSRQCRRP